MSKLWSALREGFLDAFRTLDDAPLLMLFIAGLILVNVCTLLVVLGFFGFLWVYLGYGGVPLLNPETAGSFTLILLGTILLSALSLFIIRRYWGLAKQKYPHIFKTPT